MTEQPTLTEPVRTEWTFLINVSTNQTRFYNTEAMMEEIKMLFRSDLAVELHFIEEVT